MNDAHLTLTLDIEPDDTLGTLETVLATARRGGLQLDHLQFTLQPRGAAVQLAVSADESDRLDLFALRLGNLFGIRQVERVREITRMYIA